MDDDVAHLLTWYTDIRNRQSFGYRFEPVSIEAIRGYEAFLAKLDLSMTAFDEEMIYRLDAVWMDSQPDQTASPAPVHRGLRR